MSKYTDDELNKKLSEVDQRKDIAVPPFLNGTGKCLPYKGWYWRSIDFEYGVQLSFIGTTVVICENNKWFEPDWNTTPPQTAKIRELCVAIVDNPCYQTLQDLFDYLQTPDLIPEKWRDPATVKAHVDELEAWFNEATKR